MASKLITLILTFMLISIPFVTIGMVSATRTTIGETDLVTDSYKTPSAATTINHTSQMQILGSKDNRLMIVVNNTAAAGLNITVLAGVYFRSGLGDLNLTIPHKVVRFFGPLESSRFEQADGKIYINFNNSNGTATGYRLPSS